VACTYWGAPNPMDWVGGYKSDDKRNKVLIITKKK